MLLPSKKELTIVGALLVAYLLFSFWLDHNRVPR